MIWQVWFDSDECQNIIITKCDSFDEAIEYARTIDERYDTAQVIPDEALNQQIPVYKIREWLCKDRPIIHITEDMIND